MMNAAKIRFIVYTVILILIGVITYQWFFNQPSIQKRQIEYCEKQRNVNFQGKVISTYVDYFNKQAFIFEILYQGDTSKHYLHIKTPDPKKYISKGDSIVKNKGESKYNIYKNGNPDSLVVLNFDCSYWDKK